MPAPIVDHTGKPVEHGRAKVNGVRLHYVRAGSGEPLFLLHGVPKTHYHWRHVIPLLTKRAPDPLGVLTTYRAVRRKHVSRYLAEFEWRFNHRTNLAAMIPDFTYAAVRTAPVTYNDIKWADYGA